MEIQVFGQVVISHAAGISPALAKRPNVVLAVLVARHGNLVSDDELIDALWPSDPPASAKAALQGYVMDVRDALEPDRRKGDNGQYVLREAIGYRLLVDAGQLDLAEFGRLARTPLLRPESVLKKMIELSGASVFQEFPDAAWAASTRAWVAAERVECLAELFELELSTRDGASILPAVRSAAAEFPFDERLAGLLILALYRNGRQQEALQAFSTLRDRLRAELGVSPNPQLEALHLDVLNHAAELLPQRSGLGLAPTNASRVVGPGLLGRQVDIAAITDSLLTFRSVTVVGPGGVGKSSVLREVIEAVQEKFKQHSWLDVSTIAADDLGDAVAESLGVDRYRLVQLGTVVADLIGDNPTLVILDTCEVASGAALRDLVGQLLEAPGVHVLLASRRPVGYTNERQYRLEPLELDDAVALLSRASLRQDGAAVADLRELAERLDRLPLALDMASRQLPAVGAKAVLADLDSWIAGLADGAVLADGPERHRSVQALVEWSLDLVGPAESALLARIAAMSGSVAMDALLELPPLDLVPVERVRDVVGALVDASLIMRVDDTPSFKLLDTVASVVLGRHGDEVQAQREVLANYVTRTAWADYTGSGRSTVDTWLRSQLAGSIEHLALTPDMRGVMLSTAAARMWLDRGVIHQGIRVLERALRDTSNISDPLASIAWAILGFNRLYQGDMRGSLESYLMSAKTAHTVPAPATVELVGSTIAWLECDFERSWKIASSGVEAMTVNSRRSPSNLIGFAKSAVYAGDLAGATDCYERAGRLARELDDPIAEANALRLAAVIRSLEGDHDVAWRWAHQSLVLHDPARSPLGSAQASSSMALIAMLSGDQASAETWSRIAVERARRQFDVQTVNVTIPVIAALDVQKNRPERASVLYGWLDNFIDQQQHVRHPTAQALHSDVDAALAEQNRSSVRSWSAQGAALTVTEMLQLAAQ